MTGLDPALLQQLPLFMAATLLLNATPGVDLLLTVTRTAQGGARAGAMAALDLVVSSDTAMAHLAGALGVPVWLALSDDPDWRWLFDRADSPWYPTMRLFRQSVRGDWDGVFAQIAATLRERVGA